MEKSIAILICYFGRFPWYFDYFINSCGFNPTVDFIVVTDNKEYMEPLPGNVNFIFMTMEKLNMRMSSKLGLSINIKHPYKICDFKPALGLIFSDLLEKYDYWGQCDIDVIFGDIRYFLDDEMLSTYDFVSVRHDYTPGCFMLFKNNLLMNNLFKQSKDYAKVFTSDKNFAFDESNYVNRLLNDGHSIFDLKTEIQSFTYVVKKAERDGQIIAHFDFILIEGLIGRIKFNRGKVIYKSKLEGILYHLYLLKNVYNPSKVKKPIPKRYHISKKAIYY